jgi:DNA polymerase IIIc chi subunit
MKRIRIIIEVDTTNSRATVNNMAIDLANQAKDCACEVVYVVTEMVERAKDILVEKKV